MSTNILLINVHSSRNAGDAALTHVTLQQLHENFPGCRITLAMDDPESYIGLDRVLPSIFNWVMRASPDGSSHWDLLGLAWMLPGSLTPVITYRLFGRPFFLFTPAAWRELLDAYLVADLAASKPGGFLYSSGRGVTLFVSLYILALALLAGKPVYILPQSIGPLKSGWECRLLGWVLSRARIVMVREPISIQQLDSCGISHHKCILTPDMAFAFVAAAKEDAVHWLEDLGIYPQNNEPLLGMTAINWSAQNPQFSRQDRYEASCQAAARRFVEAYGGVVILFPQVWGPLLSQDDRTAAHRIVAGLSDLKGKIYLVEQPLPPDLLKSVYGCMDLFIGARMHSNIFALSSGVPVIAIGYQQKTLGIAQIVGIEEWVVDIHQITPQILIERLDTLWSLRKVWKQRITLRMPELVQGACRVGSLVAQDYDTLAAKHGLK